MAILINGAPVAPSFGTITPTDFSDVTAHPEFVVKGKTFRDETGQLKTGTLTSYGNTDAEAAVNEYAAEVGALVGGDASTPDEVKTELEDLTEAANAKTGESAADLTAAVNTLLDGYGQGEAAVNEYAAEVGALIGGDASTPDKVKTEIQGLTEAANAKTGESDTDLTAAVNTLLDGYGKGETVEEYDGTVSIVAGSGGGSVGGGGVGDNTPDPDVNQGIT